MLSRSFYVNVENTNSSIFKLHYGVPQGSVLGVLLFIFIYTTPLSTVVISNCFDAKIDFSAGAFVGCYKHTSA
jgi:hypothetical protein